MLNSEFLEAQHQSSQHLLQLSLNDTDAEVSSDLLMRVFLQPCIVLFVHLRTKITHHQATIIPNSEVQLRCLQETDAQVATNL